MSCRKDRSQTDFLSRPAFKLCDFVKRDLRAGRGRMERVFGSRVGIKEQASRCLELRHLNGDRREVNVTWQWDTTGVVRVSQGLKLCAVSRLR